LGLGKRIRNPSSDHHQHLNDHDHYYDRCATNNHDHCADNHHNVNNDHYRCAYDHNYVTLNISPCLT
jgi:hypothetical protein